MRFWLDTEFNSYKGELISMALVGEDGREWYEVLHCEKPDPWVAQHVIPVLQKRAITTIEMAASLSMFLARYKEVKIIVDWPDDIAYFCRAIITGPGTRIDTPELTFEIKRYLGATSELSLIPHNALYDARALKNADLHEIFR